MKISTRLLALTLGGLIGVSSTAHAQGRSGNSTRGTVMWTIAGAGGGFGIGLWAGLTKFDDAINSDRKVWTSAVVGAAVGAVGGYLIGRSRAGRSRSNPSSTARPQHVSLPVQGGDRQAFLKGTGITGRSSSRLKTPENFLTFSRDAGTLFRASVPIGVGTPSR
jgi:hypothetical protein